MAIPSQHIMLWRRAPLQLGTLQRTDFAAVYCLQQSLSHSRLVSLARMHLQVQDSVEQSYVA